MRGIPNSDQESKQSGMKRRNFNARRLLYVLRSVLNEVLGLRVLSARQVCMDRRQGNNCPRQRRQEMDSVLR